MKTIEELKNENLLLKQALVFINNRSVETYNKYVGAHKEQPKNTAEFSELLINMVADLSSTLAAVAALSKEVVENPDDFLKQFTKKEGEENATQDKEQKVAI